MARLVEHASHRHKALNWTHPRTHVKISQATWHIFVSPALGGSGSLDESVSSRFRGDLFNERKENRKKEGWRVTEGGTRCQSVVSTHVHPHT